MNKKELQELEERKRRNKKELSKCIIKNCNANETLECIVKRCKSNYINNFRNIMKNLELTNKYINLRLSEKNKQIIKNISNTLKGNDLKINDFIKINKLYKQLNL